jgi:hypothetical protein
MFDIIVLACPYESSNINLIDINIPKSLNFKRDFKKIHVSIIEGKLNNQFFGLNNNNNYDILTTDNLNNDFIVISPRFENKTKNSVYYKIFSENEINDNFIQKYYIDFKSLLKYQFFAYPSKNLK